MRLIWTDLNTEEEVKIGQTLVGMVKSGQRPDTAILLQKDIDKSVFYSANKKEAEWRLERWLRSQVKEVLIKNGDIIIREIYDSKYI